MRILVLNEQLRKKGKVRVNLKQFIITTINLGSTKKDIERSKQTSMN